MSVQFGLQSFLRTVTTAGTRVAVSASGLYAAQVALRAPAGNSGVIFVGGSDVSSANGWSLAAGDTLSYGDLRNGEMSQQVNMSLIWIDASVNGEGIQVIYSKQSTVAD